MKKWCGPPGQVGAEDFNAAVLRAVAGIEKKRRCVLLPPVGKHVTSLDWLKPQSKGGSKPVQEAHVLPHLVKNMLNCHLSPTHTQCTVPLLHMNLSPNFLVATSACLRAWRSVWWHGMRQAMLW